MKRIRNPAIQFPIRVLAYTSHGTKYTGRRDEPTESMSLYCNCTGTGTRTVLVPVRTCTRVTRLLLGLSKLQAVQVFLKKRKLV